MARPGFSGDGGLATSAQLAYPSGVYVDVSGNIFIADGNNCIREVLAGTNIIQTVAGSGLNGLQRRECSRDYGHPQRPTSVYGDSLGNIYVPDPINNSIRAFTVGGNIHTVVGNRVQGFAGDGGAPANAELDSPTAVFVSPSGQILITDTFNYRIRVVGPAPNGNATSTTINASPNASVGGQAVTFTAAVASSAGGTPTGTVNFLDNGTQIGAATVATARLLSSPRPWRSVLTSISAQYAGNSTFRVEYVHVLDRNRERRCIRPFTGRHADGHGRAERYICPDYVCRSWFESDVYDGVLWIAGEFVVYLQS